MELDDLKRSWEQYDQKLTENLRLNQEILRRSNLDRSRREMSGILTFIGVNLGIAFLTAPWILRWTLMYHREPIYLICGCVSILFLLASLISMLKEMSMLRRIDYYNSPVVEIQKQLLAFRYFVNMEKKIGLLLVPILLWALYILGMKGIHKVDMLDHFRMLIINGVIMMAIVYPLALWFYRNFYDKKVKAAQRHLAELREFEKEEE
jgi:MFS family permease